MGIAVKKTAQRVFRRSSPWITLVVALIGLQSCTSLSTTDETLAVAPADGMASTPAKNGYPDFSRPLSAAMAQMSDEEASQMSLELEALDNGRRAGSISEAQYWARVKELKNLAASHSATTVEQIENPQ